jgi:hypothetical protein
LAHLPTIALAYRESEEHKQRVNVYELVHPEDVLLVMLAHYLRERLVFAISLDSFFSISRSCISRENLCSRSSSS